MSDLSGEDDTESKPIEETGTSKFLKKKKPSPVAAEPAKKAKVSDSTPSKIKPSGKMGFSGASAALSKAAAFTSKYAKPVKKEKLVFSDSDLDMDLSMDEDVSIFGAQEALIVGTEYLHVSVLMCI